MNKIIIGENEYQPPFDTESSAYDCPHRTVSDEAGNQVSSWDITIALNELAALRTQNAALGKRVEELERMIAHFVNVRESIEVWKKSPEMYAEEYLGQSESELESVIACMKAMGNKPDTKGGSQ